MFASKNQTIPKILEFAVNCHMTLACDGMLRQFLNDELFWLILYASRQFSTSPAQLSNV